MHSHVTVRLFAALRDRVGRDRVALEIEPGCTAGELVAAAASTHPEIAAFAPYVRVAVNSRYVSGDAPVAAGDDIAFISPVSGG